MPANLITELFHSIRAGQPNPTRMGAGERSQRQDHGTGPDFAGMLAGKLKPRPRPEPKPEPTDPKPKAPDEAADRSRKGRKKPEQAADIMEESSVEQLASDQEGTARPAPENSENVGAEQEPPVGERIDETKENQPALQAKSRVHGAASTPSPAVATAAQAGFSAVFDALFAGGSKPNVSNNRVLAPISAEGSNTQGSSGAGQNHTALPQTGGSAPQGPRVEMSIPAEADIRPAPQAVHPDTPKASVQSPQPDTAPTQSQTSATPSARLAAQEVPQQSVRNLTPPPVETAARPVPLHSETPSKLPVTAESATVIPTEGASGSPLVARTDHGNQTQAAGNDNGVALDVARILLGVRVMQATTEQALETGQPSDPTLTSEGKVPGGPAAPATTGTMVVAPAGGAEEAGNPSLRLGPNTSGDARATLIHAGEQGPESSPAEQVVQAARAQIGARQSQVHLQLEPPELGQVRIDVRMNGKTLQMYVQTETEQAHQLLNSRAAELRNTLQAQGLNVERLHIELRSPGQSSSPHHQQDQSGTNHSMRDAQPDAHRGGHQQSEGEPEHAPARNEAESAFEATTELNEEPEESPATAVNLVA